MDVSELDRGSSAWVISSAQPGGLASLSNGRLGARGT